MYYRTGLYFAMSMLLIFSVSCTVVTPKQNTSKISAGKTEYLIVVPPKSELALRAAKRLQNYIEKTSSEIPKIEEKSELNSGKKNSTTIVVGPAAKFKGLDNLIADDLEKISGEGYILKTISKNGNNYVLALGKSERGAANAV